MNPVRPARPIDTTHALETAGAWLLGALWILPLAYAVWTAFHPGEFSTRFVPTAPLTLDNFARAWAAAPFARYFLNTVLLCALILVAQLVLCTLAAYAFARFVFPGRSVLFALVLLQLMVMPDVLIVENYRTMSALGLRDTIVAIALPYMASAFGIFLLRQTFKTVPKELDEAARVEGCTPLQVLWKVYVPLARPVYLAYALVSVSFHWNNFLWPLIITNSVESRPLTVGLQVFSATDQGIDWSIITAATLLTSAPLLIAFFALSETIRTIVHASRYQMKLITWNVQWCRGIDGKGRPGTHREACQGDRRLRRPVPAGDRQPFSLAASIGKPWRESIRRASAPAPRLCAGAGRCGRCARGGRRAPALRQHDPVAAPRRTGLSPSASLSLRGRSQRNAADRPRGRAVEMPVPCASSRRTSSTMARESARPRSRRCAGSTARAASMRAWAASSIRPAAHSTPPCGPRRPSSPAIQPRARRSTSRTDVRELR